MFKKLVGNEHVKQTLRHLLANGRVPNSLLFAGDDGVGKRQFALELAKSYVCADPMDGEACDTCPACLRADTFVFPKSDKGEDYDQVFLSAHPDVGTVVPFKRNVRIGAIRTLEREANFRPFEAKARFFIVDHAEKMADPAANALLKTLEEPSSTTHIFLITSRPDSLLPTIRSRCQTLRFAPINADEIEKFLIDKKAFTHDEARLAARLSRGSIGRAVSINVEKFRVQRERMLGVVTNVIETGDRAALLRIAEELNDLKNKDNFEDNLDILQSLIHDVWSLRVGGDESRIVNTDLTDELTRLAENSETADMPAWLAEIDTMRGNLAVNINRKIAADALFVSMAGV
ncbi:MAG: DNA polymerase III subunit delta' [Acidobacteriota bacterium]